MHESMQAGIRVIRGPDWKWGDQDGGVGHIGTVIKPGFPLSHNTVVNGSVFVRWDSGKVGNYNIAEQHDLQVYSSICAGIEHQTFCDTCKEKQNILGTHWKCDSCEVFNLCDSCYHGDQHELDHQFLRQDLLSSEGVLVPARKCSEKLKVKGVFPGAIVVRNVEDWVLGQSDDGAQGTTGTAVTYEDNDNAKSLQNDAATSQQRTKAHGCVRVRWATGNIIEHRRGFDGKVDVFCRDASDAVSGGTCYADHLAVLDSTMMLGNTDDGDSSEKEDIESNDGYDSSDDSRIMSHFCRAGSLDELLALSGRVRLLHQSDRFNRGDRVRVLVDPDQFKKMQDLQYGGWDDPMALYIGLTGTVRGVLSTGAVVVHYANMPHKKLSINPDALTKQDYFIGDSVQILAEEASVRQLQIGHGGWVYRMKEILGKVGEIVQLSRGNAILVKLDKMEWLLNIECCKLMDDSSSVAGKKDFDSDCNDEGTTLSRVVVRSSGDSNGILCADGDLRGFLSAGGDLGGILCASSDMGGILCAGGDLRSFLSAGGDLGGMMRADAMPRLLKPEMLVRFAASNEIRCVKAILAQHPDQIEIKNKGKTALHLSSVHGHIEMVKYLVEHGANILEPDDDGNTAVHYAVNTNEADVLEVLLAKDDDNANVVNYELLTVLQLAVHKQAISCIEVLLRHNVNVNAQNDHGDTALHVAVLVGCLGAIDLIVAHPTCDFFVMNQQGLTALQLAVGKNELYAIKSIIRHAPQKLVDFQTIDGMTALHIACLNGLYDATEVLITQGKANMELVNNNHHTSLLCALFNASIVELLASHGANVNAYDGDYDTGLHLILMAIASNDTRKRNHTANDMFNAVQTSLIYSELPESLRYRQWVAVACCLVRYGADIYQANCAGITPIGLAADSRIRDALLAASKNRFPCIPKT